LVAEPETLPPAVHDGLDEAARRDPDLRDTLELLAGHRPHRPDRATLLRRTARHLNQQRGLQLRDAFVERALTSPQVAEILGVADHRAVQGRRARRTLLGWTIGNETYHPDWQFTDDGTVVGLAPVVRALGAVTSSPLAADRIMRHARDELDGRSLADLLADGRSDLVVRLIAATDV
jgi:hypothetical protein